MSRINFSRVIGKRRRPPAAKPAPVVHSCQQSQDAAVADLTKKLGLAQARIDELLTANTRLVEEKRALQKKPETVILDAIEVTLQRIRQQLHRDDAPEDE